MTRTLCPQSMLREWGWTLFFNCFAHPSLPSLSSLFVLHFRPGTHTRTAPHIARHYIMSEPYRHHQARWLHHRLMRLLWERELGPCLRCIRLQADMQGTPIHDRLSLFSTSLSLSLCLSFFLVLLLCFGTFFSYLFLRRTKGRWFLIMTDASYRGETICDLSISSHRDEGGPSNLFSLVEPK